jgi:hypothetical protein
VIVRLDGRSDFFAHPPTSIAVAQGTGQTQSHRGQVRCSRTESRSHRGHGEHKESTKGEHKGQVRCRARRGNGLGGEVRCRRTQGTGAHRGQVRCRSIPITIAHKGQRTQGREDTGTGDRSDVVIVRVSVVGRIFLRILQPQSCSSSSSSSTPESSTRINRAIRGRSVRTQSRKGTERGHVRYRWQGRGTGRDGGQVRCRDSASLGGRSDLFAHPPTSIMLVIVVVLDPPNRQLA